MKKVFFFLAVALSCGSNIVASGYYDQYGRYHPPAKKVETVEEAKARMNQERTQRETQATIAKEERIAALALKGQTMALIVEALLQNYIQNTISGKTRQELVNKMAKWLVDSVGDLDPYHPFHKDLKDIKTNFMGKAQGNKVNFAEHFAQVTLAAETAEEYQKGVKYAQPTKEQLEVIAGDEKLWQPYLMYVVQELEVAQSKCKTERSQCLEDVAKRAGGFARDVDTSKKKEAPHAGALSNVILDAVDDAWALSQQMTRDDLVKIYRVTLEVLEGYLAHGAREKYTEDLRIAFRQNPDLKKVYEFLKSEEEQGGGEVVAAASPMKRLRKSYVNPWPEVETEAEKLKKEKEKKAEEAKAKEARKREKQEKNESDPTRKITGDLQKKGFGLLEKMLGKLF